MAKAAPAGMKTERKRQKRTITDIRESKKAGEKMVYMSVPDYTSAQWAVKEGTFPDDEHSYTVHDAEYEEFATMVAKRRQI